VTRFRTWLVAAFVAAVVVGGVCVIWPRSTVLPPLTPADVEAIEIQIEAWETTPARHYRTADEAAIARFLAAIRTARPATEHMCGTLAYVSIHCKNGSVESLGILPGHDPRFYEYRYARTINRVERVPFLEALAAIGVRDMKVDPP
jgi:hypothetical protein